jgi:glutathione S-transferase
LAPENPLMKVPSLVTDDGQILFDSPVICEYLDNLAGGCKLFPGEGPARWAALRQQALGGRHSRSADPVPLRGVAARRETVGGWTEGQMRKAHQGLAAVEREDLSGPRTIGHIATGCMLGYLDFRFPDDRWRQRHPQLARWYEEFAELPGMKATRPPAS